ncbi:unnamed protein product [Lathyrus sativus]|nr:unnamed protein product [Lathyrus sativus]
MRHSKFDVARVMVRSSYALVVNEVMRFSINGEEFHIKIIEDNVGPLRLVSEKNIEVAGNEEVDLMEVHCSGEVDILVVMVEVDEEDIVHLEVVGGTLDNRLMGDFSKVDDVTKVGGFFVDTKDVSDVMLDTNS